MKIEKALSLCQEENSNNLSPKTAVTYAYSLRKFKKFLETTGTDLAGDLTQITAEYFIDFNTWLAALPLKRGSLLVYLAAGRSFHEWMVIHGHLEPTPREELRYKKSAQAIHRRKESKLPKSPSAEDLEAVRQVVYAPSKNALLRLRNIALFETLYCTGGRCNELSQLRLRDIDLGRKRIIVTGKNDKERYAFLSDTAVRALRDYWDQRGYTNPTHHAFMGHERGRGFSPKRGLSNKTVWQVVKTWAKIAGIEDRRFSPHFFRHAFATKMLAETSNLALVQDLLGHATPAATRIYAKITTSDMQSKHEEVYG